MKPSSDLQSILQELARPMGILDMQRRVQLCQQALTMADRADQPQLWAGLQVELANSLAQNHQGEGAENFERAIKHYQQALEVMTRMAMPSRGRRRR